MATAGIPISRREIARQRLARSFEGYANPGREILLGLRRARILHGTGPAEAMEHWLEGRQAPGLGRLPVPLVVPEAKAVFLRLRAERDAIPTGLPPGSREAWARNGLWAAMHVLAVQVVDPWWKGPLLAGMRLPNRMDWDFLSDREGVFHDACWSARSNPSYLVATADEDRIPDFSASPDVRAVTPRLPLSSGVIDRMRSAGMELGRALREVLGDRPDEESLAAVLADLEDAGLYAPLDVPRPR